MTVDTDDKGKRQFRIKAMDLDTEEQVEAQIKQIAQHWIDDWHGEENLMQRMWGALDNLRLENLPDAEDNTPRDPPLACHAGCYWCCYLAVELLPMEADILDRYIRSIKNIPRQAMLRMEFAKIAKQKWDHAERLKAKVPCPFLDPIHKTCTVYQIRPGTCRQHHSTSVRACKFDVENVTNTVLEHQYAYRQVGRAIVFRAAIQVLEAKGLSAEWKEMSQALVEKMK